MTKSTTTVKNAAANSWAAMKEWKLRSPLAVAATAVLAIAVVIAGTFTALSKTVTITVDGVTQKVTTLSGTVSGALDSAGLSVGDHDALAPAATASIASGSQIILDRGRELTVTLDGTERSVWTTERTVGGALTQLGAEITNLEVSTSLASAIPLEGLDVVADTFHTVDLHLIAAPVALPAVAETEIDAPVVAAASTPAARSGQVALTAQLPRQAQSITTTVRTVGDLLADQNIRITDKHLVSPAVDTPLADDMTIQVRTLPTVRLSVGGENVETFHSPAVTVEEFLTEAGVTLGKHDTTNPELDTTITDNLPVTVTRISYETTTKTIDLKQPKDKTVNDPAMDKGKKKVTQEGRAGKADVTYKTKIVNGEAGKPKEVSRDVLVEPRAKITKVGTKSEAPREGSGQGSAPAGVWAKLAQCESGGRPGTNTGNGYYGMYQFSLPTWRSVGGTGLPSDASAAEQTKRAQILQARSGWGQWPACTRMLGLR